MDDIEKIEELNKLNLTVVKLNENTGLSQLYVLKNMNKGNNREIQEENMEDQQKDNLEAIREDVQDNNQKDLHGDDLEEKKKRGSESHVCEVHGMFQNENEKYNRDCKKAIDSNSYQNHYFLFKKVHAFS